jgi:hypothetical protein
MKTVLQHIFRRKRRYAQLPFFEHLRDGSLTVRDRLAFLPCMAPFILSFADLNRYVLREEPTSDRHQAMLNAHSHEDDHHWPWFLQDLATLGHDSRPVKATDHLRFLWSDETAQSRLLAHRLAHLIWTTSPVIRLAVVEAIEETGNVLFALTADLARAFERETGRPLVYCGDFHFQRESGHAMNNDHAELAAIELSDDERAQAIRSCDQVFTCFEAWTEELLRYQERHGPDRQAPRELAMALD